MYFSDDSIERFIKEDVPYIDLTTLVLGIAGKRGKIEFISREEAVVCGTEEVLKIFSKLNIVSLSHLVSGSRIHPQTSIIQAEGSAEDLHMAWKISTNILEYASGIATRTDRMLGKAKQVNEKIEIVATRKIFPGTKELSTKAVIAGGGLPHRLGLSETVLVFKEHLNFIGGLDGLVGKVDEIKARTREKKFIIEVGNIDDALKLCKAGVDGIQFDKISALELKKAVELIRVVDSGIVILAAGGINETNVEQYTETGIDAIVTSSVYFGKPVDIRTEIVPIG